MADNNRRSVDWEAIHRAYRAGQVSVREIARQYAITEGAIRKRAKAEHWQRALADRVKEAVKEELVRSGTREGSQSLRDDDIVREHAVVGADVVRSHRGVISRGRDLTLRLLDELDATTSHVGALEEMIEAETKKDKAPQRRTAMLKAVALPSRAGVIKDLSAAAKNWVTLERQAFNLGDDGGQPEDPATKADLRDALGKLNQGQRDSLRDIAAALVAGAKDPPSGA